jgi:DNA repair exonuclease SbcCD ATPase subunit
LVRYLETRLGGHWSCLADAIESTHQELDALQATLGEIRARKQVVLTQLKSAKAARAKAERALGEHWRAALWEKDPSAADWARREELQAQVTAAQAAISQAREEFRALQAEQNTAVTLPQLDRIRERRRAISLEAELMRATLAREAIVTVHGLRKAGHRPSAWWMSLVCPGGAWFRATLERACAWWEPL